MSLSSTCIKQGQRLSPKTEFKKGSIPWNKGLKGFGRWSKKSMKGSENPSWKGDSVGYFGLHLWVNRHLGKPQKCEFCEKVSGRFVWANKSKKYKRDMHDWIRLCYSCHHRYDQIWVNRDRDQGGRFI